MASPLPYVKNEFERGSIDVTCGEAVGRLYFPRFKDGRSRCVEVDGQDSLLSLNEFERLGGKGNNKKWKTSVKHKGKTLEFWLKNGLTLGRGSCEVVPSSVEQAEERMDTTSINTNDPSDNCLPEFMSIEVSDKSSRQDHDDSSSTIKVEEMHSSSDEEIEPEMPLLVKHGETVEKRFKKLFHHQIEALDKLDEWFSNPLTTNKKAVIAMPTGSGKTGVICCLPYKLGALVSRSAGNACGLDLKKPILIIAPDLTILNQLDENLQPVASADVGRTFVYKLKIVKPSEKHVLYRVERIETSQQFRQDIISMSDIILTNCQKMHVRESLGKPITWQDLPDDMFSCVVVDEGHHLPAPTWKRIIEKFGATAKVAFFTATPYRSDKKPISEDLPSTGLAYHLPRFVAIDRRIIRDTNFVQLQSADEESGAIIMILKKVNELLLEKDSSYPFPNGKKHTAIAIAKSQSDADNIKENWSKMFDGNDAEVYHSKIPKGFHTLIMKKLREGNVKLLIVVDMLREGFDYPPISIAAILRKIESPVTFTQFIGRAQRIVRDGRWIEPAAIKADIITHTFYKQELNYENFCDESLIPTS